MKYNGSTFHASKNAVQKKHRATVFYTLILVFIIIVALNVQNLTKPKTTTSAHQSKQLIKQNANEYIKKEPLVIWSSDFHIATIADIKHFLSNKNVKIIDKVGLFQILILIIIIIITNRV